jgi:hypothetical protein
MTTHRYYSHVKFRALALLQEGLDGYSAATIKTATGWQLRNAVGRAVREAVSQVHRERCPQQRHFLSNENVNRLVREIIAEREEVRLD